MHDHTSLLGCLEDDSLLEFWLISGLKAVSHNHFIPRLHFLRGQGLRADHGAERCKT